MADSTDRAILLLNGHPTLATTVRSTIANVAETDDNKETLLQARLLESRFTAEVIRTAELKSDNAELKSDNAELNERLDASKGDKEKLAEKIATLEERIAELERDDNLAANEKRASSRRGSLRSAKASSSSPPRTPLQKAASLASRVFSPRATRNERKRRDGNEE